MFITPNRKAGGDDSVERDHLGRPLILTPCASCGGSGRLPSEKRPGNTVKCQPCAGAGMKRKAHTRVTTFIDVLDSKDNLMDWKARNVLIGVAKDPSWASCLSGCAAPTSSM